ncbi:MAG TPA: hypothetical protein VNN76_05715 [Bacteroidota bacterium]|nr:hypothetical protein [Bacteroidota bacterium]
MNSHQRDIREVVLHIVVGLLFVTAMSINFSCEDPNEPDRSKCGSGSVYLDPKTDLCKDRADGSIVPRECCQ